MSKKIIYGRHNTIHHTKLLNIEIDKQTGKIVSVWFRCMSLPFDVTYVDKERVDEMERMYKTSNIPKINAVEVKGDF